MKKFLRLLTAAIALLLLLYAGGKLLSYEKEMEKSSTAHSQLRQMAVETSPPVECPSESIAETVPEETAPLADPPPIEVDFSLLKDQCPDIVGWIYCPDTVLNYPIAQGPDNAKYLHRLPDGQYSVGGTLFLDFQNTRDFSDLHSVIYGHHMQNRSMFGSLPRYKEEEFRREHSRMWLLTPDGNFQCDVAAAAVIPASSEIYDFPQRFQRLQEIFEQSLFPAAFEPREDRHYLALSTCSYEFMDARFLLLCQMTPCKNN